MILVTVLSNRAATLIVVAAAPVDLMIFPLSVANAVSVVVANVLVVNTLVLTLTISPLAFTQIDCPTTSVSADADVIGNLIPPVLATTAGHTWIVLSGVVFLTPSLPVPVITASSLEVVAFVDA